MSCFHASHPEGGEGVLLKRNLLNFIFLLIYFQLPNLCVARNETTSFSACLPQSKQTAATPSPSLAGAADGPFEAKLPTS